MRVTALGALNGAGLAFPAVALSAVVLVTVASAQGAGRGPAAPTPDVPQSAPWAEVVPFSPRGEATLLRWSPADRHLELPAVETGAALVCLGGEGVGIECRQLDLSSPAEVQPWPVPGVLVEGRVLLGREPLAGAELAVVGSGYRLRRSYVLPLAVEGEEVLRWVETSRDGRFELPQLAPGEYRLEVRRPGGKSEMSEPFTVPARETLLAHRRATRSGDQPSESPPQAREASAGGQLPIDSKPPPSAPPAPSEEDRPILDLGPIVLEPGLEVEVSVLNVAGEPLAGARVGAIQGEGPAGAPTHYAVHTDEEGRAVLSGAEPGIAIQISCKAPGFLPHREEHPSPPTDVVCILERTAGVSGRVAASGEPVAGATAGLYLAAGHGAPPYSTTTTGGQGSFDLGGLVPGPYRLAVAARGFRVEERRFELSPGERLDLPAIELTPAAERTGVVVDALSGEPVPGVSIVSLEPVGLVETVSDPEGRFEIAVEGAGAVRLQLTSPDYPVTEWVLSREVLEAGGLSGSEDSLRLELAPGGRIEAWVVSESTAQPCLGCDLSFYRTDGASEASSGALTTGADGRAQSRWLPPGPYRVVLERVGTHGTTVTVTSGDEARDVRVETHRLSRVTFGPSRDTLAVRLWPPPPPGWEVAAGDEGGWRTYEPDSTGRFIVRRAPGSALHLRLQGRVGSSTGSSLAASVSLPTTVSLPTVPAEYEESRLELELPRTRVRGRLSGDPGEIVGSLRALSLTGSDARAWTLSGPDGTFDLPFLAPGSYLLALGNRELATFTLAPGQELTLEAEVPPAAGSPRPW